MQALNLHHPGRSLLLFFGSLVFALYVLAPVAWLVSSSFQPEAEITSRPPHWIPHQPTMENFEAIFHARDDVVTYANRKRGDSATGGSNRSSVSVKRCRKRSGNVQMQSVLASTSGAIA